MLHFRSIIMPALMAGAALFLPHEAFAEKPETSGQAIAHVVESQVPEKKADHVVTKVNVPSKPEQAKTVVEKKPTVPVPASKAQGPSVQRGLKQAVSQKQTAVPKPKPLPVQVKGNGYGHSTVKQTVKPAAVTSEPKEESSPVTEKALERTDLAVAKRTTVPREQIPVEIKVKQVERMEPVVPERPVKSKVPADKEELPTADQTNTQVQRSNGSSGGQSNDRGNQGLHTINFLEKWFEWNKYYESMVVHPFLSRYNLKHHQWVNAPPSQPPQSALFLKLLPAAKAYGTHK